MGEAKVFGCYENVLAFNALKVATQFFNAITT